MTKIELFCEICGKSFFRIRGEWNRSQKLGRKDFCSRRCSCIYSNKVRPNKGNVANLVPDNNRDEFTPFRFFIKVAKYRTKTKDKFKDMNLDLPYLKRIWEEQSGVCPISGTSLTLPRSSDRFGGASPYNASLDRVDNSLGYVKGNVRFISHMANIARGAFTDEQLIEFCQRVVDNIGQEE